MVARTVEDFVEDLVTDCRSKKHILAVARNTHWASRMDEVEQLLKKYFNKNKNH